MSSSSSTDIHFQALCGAVEHERIDKCRSILQASSTPPHRGVDLSATNNDGFTPLELAFMTGKPDLVKLMLEHGGVEQRSGGVGGVGGRSGKRSAANATPEGVSAHLQHLANESKKQVDKFGQLIKAAHSSNSGSAAAGQQQLQLRAQLTQSQLRECEKQQTLWQKRLATLRRLRAGFDASGRPHAPAGADLGVVAADAVAVRLAEPEQVTPRSLYTKCRVQWSHSDSFAKVEGELEAMADPNRGLQFRVGGLTEGKRYFVRAAFGNPKGFGPFSASTPKSVVPSSWRSSFEDAASSTSDGGRVPRIGQHLVDVCERTYRSASGDQDDDHSSVPSHHHHNHRLKKRGFRHLFSTSSAPKFQKGGLSGGRLYLCCIFYNEDKVLMTNDECLPVMEVATTASDDLAAEGGAAPSASAVTSDLNWLSRLSRAWRDAERLRHEAAKLNSGGGNGGGAGQASFSASRIRLLQTVLAMQQALGVTDLGTPFHRPLTHPDGSAVLCLTSNVKNPKTVVSLSLKWVPLSKAQRRVSFDTQVAAMDSLRYSLREMMLFHQVCQIRLNPGLYLCHVRAHLSVSQPHQMRLVASATSPSVTPYVRLRENPHVNREEWDWLRTMAKVLSPAVDSGRGADASAADRRRIDERSSMQAPSPTTNFLAGETEDGVEADPNAELLRPTEAQYAFGLMLRSGAARLLDYVEVADEDERSRHRVFHGEVVEVGGGVSVILLLPAPDFVCTVTEKDPDHSTDSHHRQRRGDLLPVSLQVFESVHLSASHPEAWTAFCRASLHLELALAASRQAGREAFSPGETRECRRRADELAGAQSELEAAWRPARWVHDVISRARDKSKQCGLEFGQLCKWYDKQTTAPDDSVRYSFAAASSSAAGSQGQQRKAGGLNSGWRREEAAALTQINAARPFDPAAPASASGTLITGGAFDIGVGGSAAPSSHSGGEAHATTAAGLLMASKGLTRTPTTRSDPLEFNLAGSNSRQTDNKENEVRNFPGSTTATTDDQQQKLTDQNGSPPSSFSSLTFSQNSNSSSLSSNEQQQHLQQVSQPQYENLQQQQQQEPKRSFEPRVAQGGRFSHQPGSSSSSSSQQPPASSSSPEPNVLQVFAAYETGLASGTSVRLNVTQLTTAREVVDLVIRQLNMAVILKGRDGPVYDQEAISSFCLVAVIGNRERCLRDDFKPLNLQNPWKKGKLFVRMKNDLLAAIDHISRHSTVL